MLDVAGRFDTDGAGGSRLKGFGFLGDGEGGGTNAEEREAREGGEGEHGVVLSEREMVSTVWRSARAEQERAYFGE